MCVCACVWMLKRLTLIERQGYYYFNRIYLNKRLGGMNLKSNNRQTKNVFEELIFGEKKTLSRSLQKGFRHFYLHHRFQAVFLH